MRSLRLFAILLSLALALQGLGAQDKASRLDIFGGADLAPSYGSGQALLWAAGGGGGLGLELLRPAWIPLRAQLDWFGVGASTWDPSLFRYRAFNGFRMAALSGLRLDLKGPELDLFAGLGASAVGYTGISEATAYLSILAEARLLVPLHLAFLGKASLVAALPLEYMLRGDARTISAGLDLGLAFLLPQAKGAAQ